MLRHGTAPVAEAFHLCMCVAGGVTPALIAPSSRSLSQRPLCTIYIIYQSSPFSWPFFSEHDDMFLCIQTTEPSTRKVGWRCWQKFTTWPRNFNDYQSDPASHSLIAIFVYVLFHPSPPNHPISIKWEYIGSIRGVCVRRLTSLPRTLYIAMAHDIFRDVYL